MANLEDLPGTRALRRRESRRTQTFQNFLTMVSEAAHLPKDRAEEAAVAVVCALDERLTTEQGEHLEAQLPQRLRELVWRCDRHVGSPPRKLDREGFLEVVAGDLGLDSPAQAEPLVRTVFAALRVQVTEGEADKVMGQLPSDLKPLWQRAI